ncbi:protein kinase [Streptomyces sp. URMC 129]|uniref:protein kinase n=1 Tax=Streptomyces sp. URMC 129 TaxID=3423407 RepID=UPI003F1D5A64
MTDIRPPDGRGFGSDLTAVVESEKGAFFVKGMRNQGWRRVSIVREKLINPFVQPFSPPLRWQAEDDEWMILGFDLVEGRPSDFEPGSPDLPSVVQLLDSIGKIDLPGVARDWPETRWDRFAASEAEAELFRGDALLHADINPENVLIGRQNAWLVDWSWPTYGAAFIDPACLVVQLVAAGHSAGAAEAWVARCTAWVNADSKAIDVFAAAYVRMLYALARRRPEETWRRALAEAAEAWTNHRGVTVA